MTTFSLRSSTSGARPAQGSARRLRRSAVIATVGLVAASVLVAAGPSRASAVQADQAASASASNSTTVVSQRDRLSAISALVLRRLLLADPVAESKWVSGRPISDPAREQAVVDAAVARATQRGIDPAFVTRVVRAQIDASKVVQRGLFVRWTHDPETAPSTAPDLATIRQQLNAIDDALVDSLGDAEDVAATPRCSHAVDAARSQSYAGIDALHRKAVHTAWNTFCVTPAG